jgi:hypothetical protein
MAQRAVQQRGLSIRAACQAFRISQACYRYEARRDTEDEEIAQWLLRLTDNNRTWGFGRALPTTLARLPGVDGLLLACQKRQPARRGTGRAAAQRV